MPKDAGTTTTTVLERWEPVSIFPTRILLATDSSKEAVLAARTAVDLAERTGSELHVIHVHRILPVPYAYRGRYTEPDPEPPGGEARALLNRQAKEIENAGGKLRALTSGKVTPM